MDQIIQTFLILIILITDDMQRMTGEVVKNANQFGNAWLISSSTGIVSPLNSSSTITVIYGVS